MLDFLQGKAPGPDPTSEELQIHIEPSAVSNVMTHDRGGTREPEIRLRNVVIVSFDHETGAVSDSQQVAEVLSCVVFFGQQSRQPEREPQLTFDVEKMRVRQTVLGWTATIADHPKRPAGLVE